MPSVTLPRFPHAGFRLVPVVSDFIAMMIIRQPDAWEPEVTTFRHASAGCDKIRRHAAFI